MPGEFLGEAMDGIGAIGGLIMSWLSYNLSQREYKAGQISQTAANEVQQNSMKTGIDDELLQDDSLNAEQYNEANDVINSQLAKAQQAMQQVYNNWNYNKSMTSSYRQGAADSTYSGQFINQIARYDKAARALNDENKSISDWTADYAKAQNTIQAFDKKIEGDYKAQEKLIGNAKSKAGSDTIIGTMKDSQQVLKNALKNEQKIWNKPSEGEEIIQGLAAAGAHMR